jgi:hypothetical protein
MKPAWNVLCTSPTTQRKIGLRRILSTSALTAGFLLHGGITPWNMPSAQAAESAQAAATSDIEEVVVTGSRIVRDGYEAPTPLTVVTAEIAAAECRHQHRRGDAFHSRLLPAAPRPDGTTSVSASGAGLNLLNLRSLGANRTLILVDGQRTVGSRVDGVVDINTIPQQLVSRVDVVTGGASAAYGSDAVAGVVNFILDKKFTGIKGEVPGGVTTYGDDRSWAVSLTSGTAFGGGRGHFLVSGEVSVRDGVHGRPCPRVEPAGLAIHAQPDLCRDQRAAAVPVPASVRPADRRAGRGSSPVHPAGTPGSANALKGITFGPGGVPYAIQLRPNRRRQLHAGR